jgi:hypothetical protein
MSDSAERGDRVSARDDLRFEARRALTSWRHDVDSDPRKWIVPTQPPPLTEDGCSKGAAMEGYLRQAIEIVERFLKEVPGDSPREEAG